MNKIRTSIMGLFLLILIINLVACGGGGAGAPGSTGSIPSVITATVVPGAGIAKQDGVEGNTVDAYQSKCTQGAYVGFEEPFRNHFAELTLVGTPISTTDDAVTGDSLIFENYKVEFFPQTLGAPPIAEFNGVFQSLVLPNKGTSVVTTVILVDIDRKIQFVKDMTSGAFTTDTTAPLYVAKYTFQGKDIHGNAFTVVSQTSFFIGDYDSCGPIVPVTPPASGA